MSTIAAATFWSASRRRKGSRSRRRMTVTGRQKKTERVSAPPFPRYPRRNGLGDCRLRLFVRRIVGFAQHVAAAPDGLDVIGAAAGQAELFAQLADEHVDDFQFGLVHAAIKMVQEHLLGQRRAL